MKVLKGIWTNFWLFCFPILMSCFHSLLWPMTMVDMSLETKWFTNILLALCKYTLVDYDKLQKYDGNKYIPLKDNESVHKYHYDYVDNYDGSIVPCTYWVEEREWRRKWLKWCNPLKIVKRYIEIVFDGEVGKDKGEWKGGCTRCSYMILPNETPEECIRRMEKERKF